MEPSNRAVDNFTSPFQLTKSFHRDLYLALDPKNPTLSAAGKVVIVTYVNGPIGVVSASGFHFTEPKPVVATQLR